MVNDQTRHDIIKCNAISVNGRRPDIVNQWNFLCFLQTDITFGSVVIKDASF